VTVAFGLGSGVWSWARAAAAEDAAYSVSGVTNSEGGEAGYGRNEVVLVASAGFAGRRVNVDDLDRETRDAQIAGGSVAAGFSPPTAA